MLFNMIKEWLAKERELGSLNPDRGVLATVDEAGFPRSRIVAIREITDETVLFFTQRGTRKVKQLNANPHASMTIWLPLQQRQIILEGTVKPLTEQENENYWQALPRERQLRFATYAATSGMPIESRDFLDSQLQTLTSEYEGKAIPVSGYYYGLRLLPHTLYFYTLGETSFSELIRYTKTEAGWVEQLLSP